MCFKVRVGFVCLIFQSIKTHREDTLRDNDAYIGKRRKGSLAAHGAKRRKKCFKQRKLLSYNS